MLRVPMSSGHIAWLFRIGLFINLMAISWFAFSTQDLTGIPEVLSDKANHIIAFFVLSFCIDRGFPGRSFWLFKFPALLAYGVAIELIQSQIPGREVSAMDLLADLGAIGVYWLVRKPMRNLLTSSRDVAPS